MYHILWQIAAISGRMVNENLLIVFRNIATPEISRNRKSRAESQYGQTASRSIEPPPLTKILIATGSLPEQISHSRPFYPSKWKTTPNSQIGSRRGHFTVRQTAVNKQSIQRNKRNKNSSGLVRFDTEKAFDSIQHDGMTHKLTNLNIPLSVNCLKNSFNRDREFKLETN